MKAHQCPFCGSNKVGPRTEDGAIVAECRDCGARGARGVDVGNAFNQWNRRIVGGTVAQDGELLAFIERVGEFRAERVRVGRSDGPIRWDIECGRATVRAPTLAEAIAKARSRA